MSLDIYATYPSCNACGNPGTEIGSLNITHNVCPQIRAAGADPWEYEGRTVGDTLAELHACRNALMDPAREAEFRAFDAPNGWGTLEHSRKFIADLLALAKRNPKARWRVSR